MDLSPLLSNQGKRIIDKQKIEKKKTESYLMGEKRRMRKGGLSCSSYYSCSTLGKLESDTEVQCRQEGYIEELESGFKRNSEESVEAMYYGQIVEDVKRHEGVAGAHGIVIQEEKNAIGSYALSSGVECEWRKKSEKKLTEVSVKQTESLKKSSNDKSETRETGYGKPLVFIYKGQNKGSQQEYSTKFRQNF